MKIAALVLALLVSTVASAQTEVPKSRAVASKKAPAYLGIEFRWHSNRSQSHILHVERVAPGGPADRAGVRPGDIITHIGGVAVDFGDVLDFLLFLRDRKPGEHVALNVMRTGKSLKLIAVLGTLPEASRATWEQGVRIAQERRARAARH